MKTAVIVAAIVVLIIAVAAVAVIFDTNYIFGKGSSTTTTSSSCCTTTTGGNTTTTTTTTSTTPQPVFITKLQSGLVASDQLNRPQTQQQLLSNQSYWVYAGSATSSSSTFGISITGGGLQIGIASPTDGRFVSAYAVTPPTNATLAHAVLTAPSPLQGHYSVGLYVQSTNELLNYVACVGATASQGTTWEVVHDHATNATNGVPVPLYGFSNSTQDLTQDCTIITNGTNYLKVYLNHVVVYQSSSLQLGMSGPFNSYLESESSSAGSLVYGGYQNFYATHGESVKVTNVPSTALSAAIVDASGKVLSTAPVTAGTATLPIGKYTFPQVAYVRLYSSASDTSNSSLVASTQSTVSLYGGDIFTYGSNQGQSSTSTLEINAMDARGNNLTGIYIVLTQYRTAVASGFMPATFALSDSKSYAVTAFDLTLCTKPNCPYTFDHWSDGSTLRTKVLSITHDTQLTAYYRLTDAPAPSGMSLLCVSAVNSASSPLKGLGMNVWQDGNLVAASFSPNTFLLKDGTQYQVAVSSFGSYLFDHWTDGVTTTMHLVTGSSGTPLINLVAVFISTTTTTTTSTTTTSTSTTTTTTTSVTTTTSSTASTTSSSITSTTTTTTISTTSSATSTSSSTSSSTITTSSTISSTTTSATVAGQC